jgi:hypothetical protein
VLAAFAIAVAGTPAEAAQSKCLVAKNKCVSEKIGSLLKCEQKAETPGKPTDPKADECVDKAETKFDGGAAPEKGCFETLESKTPNDCITFDDTSSAETVVDQCVASLVAGIDPPPLDQTKCGAGKKKCVAKKLGGVLKCYQKAETLGKPTDPNTDGCIDKVEIKFDGGTEPEKGCIAKLESKSGNDCLPPTGNTAELDQLVDDCVANVIAALENPSSTTSTAPTTTTTSTTVPTTTTTSTTGPTTTTTSTTAPPTTTSTTAPPTTTTSTTAPTTTTIGPTTTTTTPTTSTTTTTSPTGVTCGPNGLDVTAALQYPPVVGGVSAVRMAVGYPSPLAIPGTGNPATVRQRVTSLLGSGFTLRPNDRDTNGDTVDDQLDVDITSTLNSIPSDDTFRVRYDCPAGTPVSPSSLSCMTSNATDPSGLPFPPEVASQITCHLTLSVP